MSTRRPLDPLGTVTAELADVVRQRRFGWPASRAGGGGGGGGGRFGWPADRTPPPPPPHRRHSLWINMEVLADGTELRPASVRFTDALVLEGPPTFPTSQASKPHPSGQGYRAGLQDRHTATGRGPGKSGGC